MAAKQKTTKTNKTKTVRKSSVSKKPETFETNFMEASDFKKPKKYSYKYLVLIVFLVLLLSSLYLLKGHFVAALVNGRPITRMELTRQLEKSGGQQALDNLVTKEMILQEARKKNVTVNNEEVTQELDKLSKQLETEGTTLDSALAMRGMNREGFEENLRVQKLVEKLLESDINVSDDEVLKYFNDNKALMGENAKYEDLKEDLKLQLKQEKLDVGYEKLYNKLKEESDIKYFVTF